MLDSSVTLTRAWSVNRGSCQPAAAARRSQARRAPLTDRQARRTVWVKYKS